MSDPSLYTRLGGYDVIAVMVDTLMARVREDSLLGRFWASPRGDHTVRRERQFIVDYAVEATGGPAFYVGRDMKTIHKGMGITEADYTVFINCLTATMDAFNIRVPEQQEILAFITSLEPEIVEHITTAPMVDVPTPVTQQQPSEPEQPPEASSEA